jgi:hypothetical protein
MDSSHFFIIHVQAIVLNDVMIDIILLHIMITIDCANISAMSVNPEVTFVSTFIQVQIC